MTVVGRIVLLMLPIAIQKNIILYFKRTTVKFFTSAFQQMPMPSEPAVAVCRTYSTDISIYLR